MAADVTVTGNVAAATGPDGWTTDVTFYSPSIVRVTKYPGSKAPDKKSYSVIMSPQNVELRTGLSNGVTTLSSSSITAGITAGGTVSFFAPDGKPLISETAWSHTPCTHKVDEGKFKVSQSYKLQPEEMIFGLGQRQCPFLNQRGQNVRIWSGNTNITIPYFTSEKGMASIGIMPATLGLPTRTTSPHFPPRWRPK